MSLTIVPINGPSVPVIQNGGEAAPHFVYLIESRKTGRFKIGVSKDPKKRLHDLEIQKEEPLSLLKQWDCAAIVIRSNSGGIKAKGPHSIERALHKKFNSCCAHIEWFRLSGQTVKDLLSIQAVAELARFAGITEFNLERAPTREENQATAEAIFRYFRG